MRFIVAAAIAVLLSGCAGLPSADTIKVLDRHTGKHYNCLSDPSDPLGGYCAPADWPRLAGIPWPATTAQ
jgi:hypothetical protein